MNLRYKQVEIKEGRKEEGKEGRKEKRIEEGREEGKKTCNTNHSAWK